MSVLLTASKGPTAGPQGSAAGIRAPSKGASKDAGLIDSSLRQILERQHSLGSLTARKGPDSSRSAPIGEQLYEALANAKIYTAQVAMHIDREWRDRLFRQLDLLLDASAWHDDDLSMNAASFATFLRMLLHIRPRRRPGLGLSHAGNLIAAWTRGDDRLTIECLPGDKARWVLACTIDDERELAAADTPVARLPEALAPYRPERWFADGGGISPA